MKRAFFVLFACVLGAAAVSSQQPAAGGQTGGQKVDLATSLQRSYAGIKNNLTQAADKLSDADYTFKPGTMPEVRTYGQLFAHVAQAQFGQCSALKGEPNPQMGKQLEQELKTKAEITKALADSFAICDEVFSSTTDDNAMQYVRAGNNELTRAAALAGLIAHDNEMYGTASVYLRSKGIVPPSTEGRGRRGRG